MVRMACVEIKKSLLRWEAGGVAFMEQVKNMVSDRAEQVF